MKVVTIFPVSLVYKNQWTITAQENTQGRGGQVSTSEHCWQQGEGPGLSQTGDPSAVLPPTLSCCVRSWRTKGGATSHPQAAQAPPLTEAGTPSLFPLSLRNCAGLELSFSSTGFPKGDKAMPKSHKV